MGRAIDIRDRHDYKDWFSTQNFYLTESELKKIERTIKKEVLLLKDMTVSQRLLHLKRHEVTNWINNLKATNTFGHTHFVKRMIWRPKGKSDFRRIEPQLIKIDNDIEIRSYNIWDEPETTIYKNNEAHRVHWDVLRTLVSSAPNDGTVGRQMRFLVLDRNTKQYLGVICLSSAMFRIRAIHDEIGWNREAIKKQKKSKLNCIANGQTIVPTQPFGSAFLGGKLLSLLCLSKEVADAWEEQTGDKLVGVHTTSLFGTESGTQYDNLTPYWNKLKQETSGTTPLKPSSDNWNALKEWMRHRHPDQYYKAFVEKNPETGMLQMRENKTQSLEFCYARLGIEKSDYMISEPRGVYSSFLYKNSIQFLRDEISADDLEPAFDNSIDALTDFWRFGSMGDTTRPTDEILRKEKKPERVRKKVRAKGQLKGRVDASNYPIRADVEWYLDLPKLTWDEILERYPEKSSGTQTAQQVQPVADHADSK